MQEISSSNHWTIGEVSKPLLLRFFAKCYGKSEHRVVRKSKFILFLSSQILEIGQQGWRDRVYRIYDTMDEKKRRSVLWKLNDMNSLSEYSSYFDTILDSIVSLLCRSFNSLHLGIHVIANNNTSAG